MAIVADGNSLMQKEVAKAVEMATNKSETFRCIKCGMAQRFALSVPRPQEINKIFIKDGCKECSHIFSRN